MITFIKEFPKPFWNVYSQKCSRRCDKDQSFKGQKAEDSRQKKKSFKKSLHQIKDLQVIQQHLTKSYFAHIKGESTYLRKFIPRLQIKDFKIRRLKNSRQIHIFRISKDNSDLWFNNPRRFIHTNCNTPTKAEQWDVQKVEYSKQRIINNIHHSFIW